MPDDQTVDEIKGFIALSRKRPLNFALCYGKKPEGMTILFHRKKDPTILARLAKKEGETNKIAYGTFSTKGKVASLSYMTIRRLDWCGKASSIFRPSEWV